MIYSRSEERNPLAAHVKMGVCRGSVITQQIALEKVKAHSYCDQNLFLHVGCAQPVGEKQRGLDFGRQNWALQDYLFSDYIFTADLIIKPSSFCTFKYDL